MIGDNVYKYRKYEAFEWMFSREFKSPKLAKGDRAVLNLRGVDTLADVFVNGKLVGSPENMFIEHEFDITDFLKKGGVNKIEVIIRSPVIESKKYANIIGSGTVERTEYLNIRKAPSSFGWDIHPRIITAGLAQRNARNPQRSAHRRRQYLHDCGGREKFAGEVRSRNKNRRAVLEIRLALYAR